MPLQSSAVFRFGPVTAASAPRPMPKGAVGMRRIDTPEQASRQSVHGRSEVTKAVLAYDRPESQTLP